MNDLAHTLTIYLAIINVATFFTYGIDKLKAKKKLWRIRESSLLMLAVLGGSGTTRLSIRCSVMAFLPSSSYNLR